jgi:hypothetical protein
MLMGKQELREDVEKGIDLGVPDGILINGLGPYRFDEAVVPDGIAYQIINVEPGNFLQCVCRLCSINMLK